MKTNYLKILIIILVIMTFIPGVIATNTNDINFSVNQKDYYFKTGEDALIPLNMTNTYGKEIDGLLTYTYTQEINQGNMRMSSSNSQSTNFLVKEDKSTQIINFGTSDAPSILKINLKFTYAENESRVINLEGISIHFVSDESQKQNQQNQQSSSSQSNSATSNPQNSAKQDPFSQMQQQLNNMMNQNSAGQNNNQQQSSQQALQNNQMNQDSSALKKQISKENQEQNEIKKNLGDQIANNQDFQKEHQKLLNKGFNATSLDINPSSNNSGSFEVNYQDQNGNKASLKGNINDSQISNLQKDTPETRNQIINQTQSNKQFQKYNKKLQDEGYTPTQTEINTVSNKTTVQSNYVNEQNETAKITTNIINNTVKNVKLEENKTAKKSYLWFILILLLIIGAYIYYVKHKKKNNNTDNKIINKKVVKLFNYKQEASTTLEQAKIEFENEHFKEAYGLVGQSLRLFLSYKNKLNKEITNDEIINFLRIKKLDYKKTKECFDICSLVEFAKYKANKKDFDKIINFTEKTITK